CFDPRSRLVPIRDWCSIVEAWGPMVASTGEPFKPALAEIGCFLQSSSPKCLDYVPPSKSRPFLPRGTVPPEAFNAYVVALQTTDGPDVAFLRFYRIFELEFAATIQNEVQAAPLSRVYEMIR